MNEDINFEPKVETAPEDDSPQDTHPSENGPIQEKTNRETLLQRMANHASIARSIVGNALNAVIVNAKTAEESFGEAQKQVDKVMRDAGYY